MSREIDRQVAEALGYVRGTDPRVQGDRRRANLMHSTYDSSWWQSVGGEVWLCLREDGMNYSTNIVSAIGALEEFCKVRGWWWNVGRHASNYRVQIFNAGLGRHIVIPSFGDTLPLAICSAILEAVKK